MPILGTKVFGEQILDTLDHPMIRPRPSTEPFNRTGLMSSTVLGRGAVTGKFLKIIGGQNLDPVVSVVIRRRLAAIRRALDETPHVLRNPKGSSEWQQMNGAHTDLKELCRDNDSYPQSIRQTAANLICDITALTRSVPDPPSIDASPTNGQWEALLTGVQLREGLPSEPPGPTTVGSLRLGVSDAPGGGNGSQIRAEAKVVQQSYRQSFRRKLSGLPSFRLSFPKIIYEPGTPKPTLQCFRISRRSEIPLHQIYQSSPALRTDIQEPLREPKVVVLGAGGVGKSTIVKQLQAIQGPWNPETYDEIIIRNLISEMQIILEDMGDTMAESVPNAYVEAKKFVLSFAGSFWYGYWHTELCGALCTLWARPQVRQSARRMEEEGLLPDSSEYFFNSVDRICGPNYVPTREDVVRARIRTTGMHETVLNMESSGWHLWDTGGERSERPKWVHRPENPTAVLFVVALSDYNKVLFEDAGENRMQDTLQLFKDVVNSRWFTKNTLIILLFNKVDIFEIQLKSSPLKDWMPEYEGNTFGEARDFLEQKFINLVRNREKPLPIHYIAAVDVAAMSGTGRSINFEHVLPKLMSG